VSADPNSVWAKTEFEIRASKEPSGITGIGRTASVMHQFRKPASQAECIAFEAAVKCISTEHRRPREATREPLGVPPAAF
jgi:hypothetical protein